MLRKKERLFKKQWEFSIFHLKMLQVINLKKNIRGNESSWCKKRHIDPLSASVALK